MCASSAIFLAAAKKIALANKDILKMYIMSKYLCERCGFETNIAQTFKRHLQRKIPCPTTQHNIDPKILYKKYFPVIETQYKCPGCNKYFTNRNNKCRHIKHCMETLKNENDNLKTQINTLSSNESIHINTINININNANIQINAFGKESLDYLINPPNLKEYLLNIMNKKQEGFMTLIANKFFNEDHPENHTIYKSNKKDKFIKYYDGKRWHNKVALDITDKILIDGLDNIDTMCITAPDIESDEPLAKDYANAFTHFAKTVTEVLDYNGTLAWDTMVSIDYHMPFEIKNTKKKTLNELLLLNIYENSKRLFELGFFKNITRG